MLVNCKICGNSISSKAEQCPVCGYKIKDKYSICNECGAELKAEDTVCPSCGCPVTNNVEKVKNSKFKIIIAAICIILVIAGILGLLFCKDDNPTASTNTATIKADNISKMEPADLYKYLADKSKETGMKFTVSDNSYNFMKEHPDFFPGTDDNYGAISDFINCDISYRHLDKNIENYDTQLVNVSGKVVDVEEEKLEDGSKIVTYIHVKAYDEDIIGQYVFYYNGTIDVFKGDYIEAYMLPLSKVSFKNTSDTYTQAILGAGTYVTLVEDEYIDDGYCV